MASSLVLTIDLGTSGPKVSVYNEQAQQLDSAFCDTSLILTPDNGVEQAPQDWLNAIFNAYEIIVKRGKFNPKEIDSLSITSQWSGTVAIDKEGKPLMNGIIWMDSRGAEYAQQLTNGLFKVDGYDVFKILKWINITGGGPTKSGKDSIAHILYLKHKRPDIYNNAQYFLEPKDYLNYYFTGRVCASFDSITLHWITDNRDINNIKYHDGLIKMTGVDKEKLPSLVPTNSIIGTVKNDLAQKLGLHDKVKVISGTGDTHSAAVGSGGVKDFEAHIYVGTSGWLLTHVPFKKTDMLHNVGSIPSALPGRYLLINEQETSGACLNFVKNNILFPNDAVGNQAPPKDFYKLADEVAKTSPAGSNGVMFTPWLNGERSPVDDHHARASFINLSLKSTRADMIRSVFEGVANNNRWLMMYAEKMIGKPFEALRFIGGGANSELWCQIMADTLNREILQVEDPISANSKGAALLALTATGKMNIDDIGSFVPVRKAFAPNQNHRSIYDERFDIYQTIYKKQKGLFARLNK